MEIPSLGFDLISSEDIKKEEISTSLSLNKCFTDGYLPELEWNDDNLDYFNLKGLNKIKFKMLSVIIGENGTGKSNLLKLLRQKIIKIYNNPYPEYVVRLLSNGEISDNYDPEKHHHPFINQKRIQEKRNDLLKNYEKPTNPDMERVIIRCKDKFGEEKFKNICKDFNQTELKRTDTDTKSQFFLDEIEKLYKRYILRKLCFGNLLQLIDLELTYDEEIKKIN